MRQALNLYARFYEDLLVVLVVREEQTRTEPTASTDADEAVQLSWLSIFPRLTNISI